VKIRWNELDTFDLSSDVWLQLRNLF